MSKVVRSSKFRHVFGTPAKRDSCYDGLRITRNAWDRDFCAANPKFVAIVLEAGGGGAFAVLPLTQTGKVNADTGKVTGHRGTVQDIAWNPFNDNIIASCSEDCAIRLWAIPDGGLTEDLQEPIMEIMGHDRKVGQILWHPTAENILVSSAFDFLIKIWNVATGQQLNSIEGHPDTIYTMSFNLDGSLLATTCKDKNIRIIDPRSGAIVQEGKGHDGSKASRVVFLAGKNGLFTTGFSKSSERQFALWDTNDLSNPIRVENIDTASGVLFPFYDPDLQMIYLAGKGDGNIRYYEVDDADGKVNAYFLSEFKSSAPQRGLGFMPKRGVAVNNCEVARFFKLHSSGLCEPISMTVPRKSETFQSDLFPETAAYEPALTADEWWGGANANPKLMNLKDGFVSTSKSFVSSAPKKVVSESAPAPARSQPASSSSQSQSHTSASSAPSSSSSSSSSRQSASSSSTSSAASDAKIDALQKEVAELRSIVHALQAKVDGLSASKASDASAKVEEPAAAQAEEPAATQAEEPAATQADEPAATEEASE